MIILSIETSCDETAVSLVEAHGDFPNATYTVLGNALFSQIDIHREYGGVFPAVAKREHARTLVPMFEKALGQAGKSTNIPTQLRSDDIETLHTTLYREEGLADALIAFLEKNTIGNIDLIAVTSGPGLEPTLWVGISFAKALAYITNAPLVPVNHMEGHILSSVFTDTALPPISFPALALLISGGHTELVRMEDWGNYKRIGETRDDAVGEAFDKVARMLGLQYPGGPEISLLAERARKVAERTQKNAESHTNESNSIFSALPLPRPMLNSDDLDFSFSGLKTAVRYAIADKKLIEEEISALARDFEDAVTEVLLKKTKRAIDTHGIQTLIVGGGVSANNNIRDTFTSFFKKEYPQLAVYFPPRTLSTDNSIMIALAGHAHLKDALASAQFSEVKADGNLSFFKADSNLSL